MPISPNTALGLLASFTLATWALAWVVHERQSQSLRLHRGRIQASKRLVLRTRGRQGVKGRASGRSDRGSTSGRLTASATHGGPTLPSGLESVRAALPSGVTSTSEVTGATPARTEAAVSVRAE